ncbi:KPN_02809 family neutral zinc metallopeptidase [Blastococcus sp. PRF04-17]|uniref:KPN_02809 family neutral zinc metallopeptidase n=1 Tax=Blastococcus sp. PRF04-17 TaxID=2933797 RepID=UPI001FF12E54|nr:neutral zinc metallopeptidase [Blastococcus sp. PRF04-17]UOY03565.1 neutral zinc metallopeptidase [Blastococcus sp. PRF04-17]
MRYRESGRLDTSGISDRRGRGGMGGGRGIAVGGGGLGLVGLLIVVVLQLAGGGDGGTGAALGGLAGLGQGEQTDNTALEQRCRTGADANDSVECAVVADVESIQDFWTSVLGSDYVPTDTNFFSGSVQTACGGATSGSGPFYCPADQQVYIDLSFFDQLQTQFGAQGGLFVNAYVIAHEYGHHVQNLLGTNRQVRPGDSGPGSGTVRLELQADCYAGAWANHAETVPDDSGAPLIEEITQEDIDRALDAAARIGDDFIQRNLGSGTVDQDAFTHGSSAQRQKWFMTGYETGDPRQCDTFATDDLG